MLLLSTTYLYKMAEEGGKNQNFANKNSKFKGKSGPYKGKRQKFDHKAKYGVKVSKKSQDKKEIQALERQYAEIDTSRIEKFADFPLSTRTQKGLDDAEYTAPTEIQRETIGHALRGHDILGAAKTGSGKTLAFLIPVLELLYRRRWTSVDGLGALIISPTRELAYQTFEVLRCIGKSHDFSAGLVIGGKHLREESRRISGTNIVICTPGRLLQHMDETVSFRADTLQILVLDEADRILDMGFQQTMNAVIEHLPPTRQTLLFSATQTRSVKDLGRLSLKDPMYVSVHEHSKFSTPAKLEQSYITCELHEKLNVLWSFVKNHLKAKTLVFLSSCKQVRFVHEVFCRLRPGVTVLALHGAMQQLKRVNMYEEFCRKEFCVMFATDIASRGLDFPEVNWVLQFDCPEDANTYIHRVGRTARYQDDGEAMLMLMPSEEDAMLKELNTKKIPINKLKVNPKKLWDLRSKLQSLLAANVTLKEFAQRAFVSYVKSVYMMRNKSIFKLHELDTDEYALSLGLIMPPRIRFLQKEEKRKKQDKKKNIEEGEAILKMFQATAKVSQLEEEEESDSESLGEQVSNLGVKPGSEQMESWSGEEENGSEEGESGAEEEVSGAEEEESVSGEEESGSVEGESGAEEEESVSGEEASGSEEGESGAEEEESVSGEEESGSEEGENGSEEGESASSDDSEGGSDSDSEEEEFLTKKSGKSEKMNFDIGSENIEDLLTLKSTSEEVADQLEEEGADEPILEEQKKEKVVTKAKLVKKLLKKKITMNTKTTFDDRGRAMIDMLKKPQVSLRSEEQNYEGGINIEAAKQRMRQEDRIDRRTHRDRVRKMHMEKKLKEKARVQKKKIEELTEKPVAFWGQEEDEGPGEDPLSFLPDPDKLYGSSNPETAEDEQTDKQMDNPTDNMDSQLQPPPKKRKREIKEKKTKAEASEEILDTGLALVDDEALALQLLQS